MITRKPNTKLKEISFIVMLAMTLELQINVYYIIVNKFLGVGNLFSLAYIRGKR